MEKLSALVTWLSLQSTQKGILSIAAAIGIQLDPTQMTNIISLFLGLYGAIAAVRDKS